MDVRLPDGTIIQNVPEGITRAELTQKLAANGYDVSKLANAKTESPSFAQQIKQEALSSLPAQLGMGAIRGAGSIGATLMRPFESGEENAARRQKMDQALTQLGADVNSLGFGAGKIGAEIAGTAGAGGVLARGASMLPMISKATPFVDAIRTSGMTAGGLTGLQSLPARVAAAGIVGGASAGLIDPEEAAKGAAISAAIPAAGMVAASGGRALGNAMRPSQEMIGAAKKAQEFGIPLGVGDLVQSRTGRAVRSILSDAPITGGMAASANEAKQEAFNRAVGAQFGAAESKLTTQVLDDAKRRMGGEFDRIWSRNSLVVDPQMMQKIAAIDDVAKKLPKNEGASLSSEIQDIYSKMVPDANGNLQIPGDVANKFQQYLRRRAEGSAGLKNELGDLRQTMIQAFNRSIPEADAAALTLNRSQYKAFKTVEPLLRSAELGVAGREAGDVPAALLPQAVNKGYSNLDAPLAELAQIGSKFLVDRTAQTGGSARAALQNTALGAALMGTGGLPAIAATVPIAYGAQKMMLSPTLANRVIEPNALSSRIFDPTLIYRSAPVLAAQ